MFLQNKILLSIVFLLLLTIVLYGLSKSVIRMCYLPLNLDKEDEVKSAINKLNWTMYFPQMVMLILAFVLGIIMPEKVWDLINGTIIGLK